MMKHLKYLSYVLRHKYFVYREGRKLGLPVNQLLVHDWQKFTPTEWWPYVEKFYGPNPSGVADAFDRAWHHHQKYGGKHHWQWWLLPMDNGTLKALPMPDRDRREMLADWRGAGRAITGTNDARGWYEENHAKMILHPETRAWVEEELGGFPDILRLTTAEYQRAPTWKIVGADFVEVDGKIVKDRTGVAG